MKNTIAYILVGLILFTIVSIALGYHTIGFGVGFLTAGLALSTGYFYAYKNRDYENDGYHKDYMDRRKR
ncbi:hypothetical protein [Pseudalkalibacillus sp. SCS-8]|uniref:hypothetical protein n=1 Tax=Pseudalkalibacillus nanhaiensis TaxID=3115291 RepID=UPI0032DB40E3